MSDDERRTPSEEETTLRAQVAELKAQKAALAAQLDQQQEQERHLAAAQAEVSRLNEALKKQKARADPEVQTDHEEEDIDADCEEEAQREHNRTSEGEDGPSNTGEKGRGVILSKRLLTAEEMVERRGDIRREIHALERSRIRADIRARNREEREGDALVRAGNNRQPSQEEVEADIDLSHFAPVMQETIQDVVRDPRLDLAGLYTWVHAMTEDEETRHLLINAARQERRKIGLNPFLTPTFRSPQTYYSPPCLLYTSPSPRDRG